MEDNGRKKFLVPDKASVLRGLREAVAGVEPFDVAHLEPAANAWIESNGLTFKDFAQSARVALTGRTASPGLFEVMEVLGRDRTVERLERGAQIAESQGD
jgi:glutamyl-tRNA synthetase